MTWQAGYAETEITPSWPHVPLSGFGGNVRYAEGALAPMMAQALALRDARGHTALVLAADVLAFDPTSVEHLRRAVRAATGIPPEALWLAPSHTHWGPSINLMLCLSAGCPDMPYLDGLEAALVRLAREAMDSLSPAKVSYRAIDLQLGHNRRRPDEQGVIQWAPNEQGFYDRHTPILQIRRQGAVEEIVLVTHACHPTSSGSRRRELTPDYPGAFRDALRQARGEGARGIFAMGCGADAKVTYRNEKGEVAFAADPALARKAGETLAAAVRSALDQPPADEPEARLACRLTEGRLSLEPAWTQERLEAAAYALDPRADHWWARQMLLWPDRRTAVTYTVGTWQLGESLTMVGLEGEVCSPLGPLARSLVPTEHAMVAAYVNTMCGYIPSRRIREEGGYEGESSHRAWLLPAPFTVNVEEEFKALVGRAVGESDQG